MVKRGSTTFSATKVAKAGLAASAALTRILELEKEVGKLRHHVSVLSKRIHAMQKEGDKRGSGDGAEVASPERVQEPEPQVVAEPEVRMSGVIVAGDEEDVWVAPEAKPPVAESRVAPEAKPPVAESRVAVVVDGPEVALVRLPKGKRRVIEVEGNEEEESEEEVDRMRTVVEVPTGPRGGAPEGPRLMADRVGGVRRGSGVPADLFVKRAYRFVDRSLVGERNGMVGDTYRTRGSYARAPVVDRGGFRGRGYRPYR